jgi:hypothetical protein
MASKTRRMTSATQTRRVRASNLLEGDTLVFPNGGRRTIRGVVSSDNMVGAVIDDKTHTGFEIRNFTPGSLHQIIPSPAQLRRLGNR